MNVEPRLGVDEIASFLPLAPDLSACDAQAGSDTQERKSFEDVLLIECLQSAVGRINPLFQQISGKALNEIIKV